MMDVVYVVTCGDSRKEKEMLIVQEYSGETHFQYEVF